MTMTMKQSKKKREKRCGVGNMGITIYRYVRNNVQCMSNE